MKTSVLMRMVAILTLCCLLLGCTEQEQREVISLLEQAEKTAVSAAKTESVPLQTQAAESLKTAIAEGGEAAKTQIVAFQQTAAARAATEAAKILQPQTKAPTLTPLGPQAVDYFALGDSIASGHGLQSEKGDSENGVCKRSNKAYPYHVKELLEEQGYAVTIHHLACSGATAGKPTSKEFKNEPGKYRYKWLHNQVVDAEAKIRDDRLTLVTISIGANDIGWASPAIVWNMNKLPDDLEKWTDGIKKVIQDQLTDAMTNPEYGLLKNHPNVYVVINDLYNPLNADSFLFHLGVSCKIENLELVCKTGSQQGGLNLTACTDFLSTFECKDKADYIITAVGLANGNAWGELHKIPEYKGRIWYANVNAAFYGHEAAKGICGGSSPSEADSWIQYVNYYDSNEGIPYIDNIVKGDCFHPNNEGAKQISISVAKRLKIMRFSVP